MRIEGPVTRRYDEDMAPNAAPAPYRFTREEYHRMGEAGLFEGKRVELLDGEIITMSPQSSAHAATVAHALQVLMYALPRELVVRGQHPIVLNDESEPEPDIVVCAPQPNEYYHAHPEASQDTLRAGSGGVFACLRQGPQGSGVRARRDPRLRRRRIRAGGWSSS